MKLVSKKWDQGHSVTPKNKIPTFLMRVRVLRDILAETQAYLIIRRASNNFLEICCQSV